MAPPKAVCSVYAEVYAIWAQFLSTIADIRKAMSTALGIKNKILYGFAVVGDLVTSEVVAVATTMANTISRQILTKASALTSTVIESVLAPLLKLLMSGPEAVFALVCLPLDRAIQAADRELYFLEKAKTNLNTALQIIAKWTLEIGGGKYAQKMYDALPYIVQAIEDCRDVISKIEVDENSALTSQFDERKYASLRSNVASAIEITRSDPLLLNQARLQENIQIRSQEDAAPKIARIKTRYKSEKNKLDDEYLKGKMTAADTASYSIKLKSLNEWKKRTIAKTNLESTAKVSLQKETFTGIINNIGDEFQKDMSILGTALGNFVSNMAKAFVQYKKSQAYTYSTYSIRKYINILISKLIKLIGVMGNGAGSAVLGPLRFSLSTLESVRDMFTESLTAYSSSTETISSTALSTKLSVGNSMLISVDSTLAASITKSMIDLINSDEELQNQQKRMARLFENIEDIPDWDGTISVWGVDPTKAMASPYPRMISSTTAVISTLVTTGVLSSGESVRAARNRLNENSMIFRQIYRHNAYVRSALSSYTPPRSPYVEEFKKAMAQRPALMALFLAGPAAFDSVKLVAALAGDRGNPTLLDELGDGSSCRVSYPDLFDESAGKAQAALESMQQPVQFNAKASSDMEKKEMNYVGAKSTISSLKISIDDADLKSTVSQN